MSWSEEANGKKRNERDTSTKKQIKRETYEGRTWNIIK